MARAQDWSDLETLVCAAFAVSPAELRSRRAGAQGLFARQSAMYLAHVAMSIPYAEVAAHFGRDRTTVAHTCARIEDRRDEPEHARVFNCLEAAVVALRTVRRRGDVQ